MDLDKLKTLVAALPPGPWELDTANQNERFAVALQLLDDQGRVIVETSNSNTLLYEVDEDAEADGVWYSIEGPLRKMLEFCVAARTAVPELIAEVESLREQVADFRDRRREPPPTDNKDQFMTNYGFLNPISWGTDVFSSLAPPHIAALYAATSINPQGLAFGITAADLMASDNVPDVVILQSLIPGMSNSLPQFLYLDPNDGKTVYNAASLVMAAVNAYGAAKWFNWARASSVIVLVEKDR